MLAVRSVSLLATLWLAYPACGSSVARFYWDDVKLSTGGDLLRLQLTGPKELRFVFARPVAKYWGVLSAESYLRFDTVQRLSVWDRHDPKDQHSLIMTTLHTLRPGKYSFHLVIEGYPESKGTAFIIGERTGSFEIVP